MANTLVLHYQPGGRGDFIAGSMYDLLMEKADGAVARPKGVIYKSIHVVDDYSFLDNPNTCNVRVLSGCTENGQWNGDSSTHTLQIVHNWFTKHARMFARNPHYMTMDLCEQYYHCAHFFCIYDIQGEQYKDKYQHRIQFKDVNNIEFLNDLRLKILGTEIPESTRELMRANIARQPVWQNSSNAEVIEDVRQLIDLELADGTFLSPAWDQVPVQDKIDLLKG